MSRGFTLLEVLVAMALFFIVLTTVYQTFRVNVMGMERGRAVHRETQVARLALRMMADDLGSAYWEERSSSEEREEEEESEAPPLFLVRSGQEGEYPIDRISFFSFGPSWNPTRDDLPRLHEVEYRLAKSPETKLWVLMRREDATPDNDLLSGGDQWILAENIKGMEVECMDDQGEIDREWDSRTTGSPPRSIRIRIWIGQSNDPDSVSQPYSLRIRMPFTEESQV